MLCAWRLPRAVQAARACGGKPLRLDMDEKEARGHCTRVKARVAEALHEPLGHMPTNCILH